MRKLSMEKTFTKAAFFDLDNTLIDGSSTYYFLLGLRKAKLIKLREIIALALANYRFRRSKEEKAFQIESVTQMLLSLVCGIKQEFMTELCDSMALDILNRKSFPQMLERIEEHQIIGHDTWIVTAAPVEIAQAIAKKLNMTGAFGTCSQVSDGVYTGELVDGLMHNLNKAKAIKTLAQTHNYELTRCFAYSDSINDLPMLVSVGNPAVVNSSKELETIAIKNSWLVLK